jgi:creatinine amidohydrolase
MSRPKILLYAVAAAALSALAAALAQPGEPLTSGLPKTVELRDLTWIEVRAAIRAGYRTAIVPTGGIEQNGAHMILGKHDYIVAWAADRIALGLGRTLVAPVLSYVPEGDYDPPSGHMRWPGTLGISEAAFAGVLEGVARSLKAHGFTVICFMGDHGGSQPVQAKIAASLSLEWKFDAVRVVNLDAYYNDNVQVKLLEAGGEAAVSIGQHASIIDTSELMAVHPEGVDLARISKTLFAGQTGASGEPEKANGKLGERLIMMRVNAAIAQIEALGPAH